MCNSGSCYKGPHCTTHSCPTPSPPPPPSLPKSQDCHEMWSKKQKRRKDEGQNSDQKQAKRENHQSSSSEQLPPPLRGLSSGGPANQQQVKRAGFPPLDSVRLSSAPSTSSSTVRDIKRKLDIPLPPSLPPPRGILESLDEDRSGPAQPPAPSPVLEPAIMELIKVSHRIGELKDVPTQVAQKELEATQKKQITLLNSLTPEQQGKIEQLLTRTDVQSYYVQVLSKQS